MIQFSNENKIYDLEERTARFAEQVIDFVKTLNQNTINKVIISQLIRSTGSVAANYCEATEAESKRDFTHKISTCKKEVKESRLWLRLLVRSIPEHLTIIEKFQNEAHELLLIFSKIIQSSKKVKSF